MKDPRQRPGPTTADKGRQLWNPGRSGRMKAGLVGLSSAAIVSVYAVGYLHTSASEPSGVVAALPTANAVATVAPPIVTTKSSGQGTLPGAPATATPRATSTPKSGTTSSTAAVYKDGTYVGVGTSRHGNIEATVVVKSGKIVSAEISGCGTRYPCSKVSGLPGQVVARQSASVNYVSGATDSSKAYAGAVTQALVQAKA
ncbi:MAG: FMN-binding protein [bacterium]